MNRFQRSPALAVHEEILRLADAREAFLVEKREALDQARRLGVHSHLGYATFDEYVEALFGPPFDEDDDDDP
jgi:hypothetical protein